MSNSSAHSRGISRRLDSHNSKRHSRNVSLARKRTVTHNDAYVYALRVAYLSHLLQSRPRRPQSIIASHSPNKSSASFHDLMRDFSLVRDSKSTRYPHGFVSELEKRLTGILMGRERRKEYQDAMVKRTFGAFLNALKEHSFKKRMEKDRRVEDLVLIFFSNATKEFSKGKGSEDTSWKLMVDRHVALFVRLISLILKEHDWARERPELASRLSVLENKLLSHDEDLAESARTDPSEAVAPESSAVSSDVKDMSLVQTVAKVFGLRNTQVQSDLNTHKSTWTPKAALQDLKTYQTHLNLNTGKTLRRADFELDESYESWKKTEGPELSQMMLAVVQSNPELAKSTSGGSLPQFNPPSGTQNSERPPCELSPITSENSSYAIDQAADLSSMSLSDSPNDQVEETEVYSFIPPDPRSYYRLILSEAASHDLRDQSFQASELNPNAPSAKLLSKESTELLNEIGLRWRIPSFSRAVLFLDIFREKYVEQEIDLDTLDAAFSFVKEPPDEKNKRGSLIASATYDNSKWTLADIHMMRSLLSSLQDALLRQLYGTLMQCYGSKIPPIGPVMYVLETHVESDSNLTQDPERREQFQSAAYDGLLEKGKEVYQEYLDKEIPPEQDKWEFYHVIQLGKNVLKLCQRIQKRYRKNPEIMGYGCPSLLCFVLASANLYAALTP